MAWDQVEHELAAVIATRLGLKPDELEVCLHAAAAAAALRVINEYVGAGLLDGADPRKLGDESFAFIADAVRAATGAPWATRSTSMRRPPSRTRAPPIDRSKRCPLSGRRGPAAAAAPCRPLTRQSPGA